MPNSSILPPALLVLRRSGHVQPFDQDRIRVAILKAYVATHGAAAAGSPIVRDWVAIQVHSVVSQLQARPPEDSDTVSVEAIQDAVETILMHSDEHDVARAYVLYRENRRQAREQAQQLCDDAKLVVSQQQAELTQLAQQACEGLPFADAAALVKLAARDLYAGADIQVIQRALVLAARGLIEQDPVWAKVAARLLLLEMYRDLLPRFSFGDTKQYTEYFVNYVHTGIREGLLDQRLGEFDLSRLAAALVPERDYQFDYLGLQTLYDRYFLHIDERRIELPQLFFMRVAMGLALNELDREARAIEFYHVLSRFEFMSSTPTLFNAGTRHSQLSSCYLTTVADDLDGIYQAIKENALLQKYAGGLGNDWTQVRALGSRIKGTNGKSQGVVPFLKVVNDTAVAVNQCFAPETYIHTASGIKQIKDIREKDLVLGISGTYREVQKVLVYEQDKPMVAIDVNHSVEPLIVTDEHPFYVIKGVPKGQSSSRTYQRLESGKIAPEWIDSGKIEAGDFIAQVIPTEIVPVNGFDPEDARFYGMLLGNGHISSDKLDFSLAFHAKSAASINFARGYLRKRKVNFGETRVGQTYLRISFSIGTSASRDEAGFGSSSDGTAVPFSFEDFYLSTDITPDVDSGKKFIKHIAPRFMHLPKDQALAMLQGLLETNETVILGKEILFSSTSRQLTEGIRYQVLRMGVPSSGSRTDRELNQDCVSSDGVELDVPGGLQLFNIRIPAVPEIARLVDCRPATKRTWLTFNGRVYSRVKSVRYTEKTNQVIDLIVEGDQSYMTTSALAHNGGKRKGAVCAYLETWHLDIEEFLDLRKNTGDDRRRTHDMNTANWIPDLFMKRVMENAEWTLFSPSDVPDLHDLYGKAFEAAYTRYEALTESGVIRHFKRVPAVQLWRKMLGMLFETGHPWITFKDPCNIRSPQQHVGVVHSSNLCTEITLNTSETEIAVCNLGSVNLVAHLTTDSSGHKQLDQAKLQRTIRVAMRMLDNVVDVNFYAVSKARNANLKHRPVGLGIMGFQDCLYAMRMQYASKAAVEFADRSMEAVCYYAYSASSELAAERGRYSSYTGSLWDQGILPQDSVELLREQRGGYVEVDNSSTLDWGALRERIRKHGMRNSNCVAIAPTATISNIVGVSASIEPAYQNIYVKSNLSGEFTLVNEYLVRDLKALNLWDEVMVGDIKYFDGSLAKIDRIPADLRRLYATAFEIDAQWLVECAARRQKWIDQAQSLNIYLAGASGKKLDEIYKLAWLRGLKTTYYLRTLGATSAEKSTGQGGELNAVSIGHGAEYPKSCAIDNPECEACQ